MRKIVPAILAVMIGISLFLAGMMFFVSSDKYKDEIVSNFNNTSDVLRPPVSVTEVERMVTGFPLVSGRPTSGVTLPGGTIVPTPGQGEQAPAIPSTGAQGKSYYEDTAVYLFPLESYTYVSSLFKNRINPVTGEPEHHNGIDLASPKGTAILAADSGTVIDCGAHSTMGNYVKIRHANGYVTIYMHASVLCTHKGATVNRGDKIAEVGSTGLSTGNHLDFRILVDVDEYVNPELYLPGPLEYSEKIKKELGVK